MFLEVSTNSFIANCDRHGIFDNRQKYQSHQKKFLSIYLSQFLLLNCLFDSLNFTSTFTITFYILLFVSKYISFVKFVFAVKDHYQAHHGQLQFA